MKYTTTFIDEELNTFSIIDVSDNSFTLTQGQIGTEGKTKIKKFDNENACIQAAFSLFAKITQKAHKEGYGFTIKNEDNNNITTYSKVKNIEVKAKPKSKAKLTTITQYFEKKWSSLAENQFVINPKSIESIAAVLRWQIDNVDLFLTQFGKLADDGREAFSYGIVKNKKFIPLHQIDEYNEEGSSDEEILAKIIAHYPALYPYTSIFIKKVVLPASAKETTGGPWATEETIFGQFIVPMLAYEDEQYMDCLKTFIETNVEIRYSTNFGEMFREILDRTEAKHNEKEGKQPEDRETKLLRSFLKNYKNDVDFMLTNPVGKENAYSFHQIEKKIGYRTPTTNIFPKLMAVVKEELDKGKMPYDTIVANAYSILEILRVRIPLKRLQSVIESISKGGAVPTDNSIVSEAHDWDFWEKPNPIGGEKGMSVQVFSVRFTEKNDLEQILRQFVEKFEQYLLAWKHLISPANMHITNLSIISTDDNSGRERNREGDLFLAVSKFPELSSLVTQYVEKLTAENKKSTLLQVPYRNSIRVRGIEAAATMAYLDESTDDKLLDYLKTIDMSFLDAYAMSVYGIMRNFWKKAGKTPHLPNTFNAHPKLK